MKALAPAPEPFLLPMCEQVKASQLLVQNAVSFADQRERTGEVIAHRACVYVWTSGEGSYRKSGIWNLIECNADRIGVSGGA